MKRVIVRYDGKTICVVLKNNGEIINEFELKDTPDDLRTIVMYVTTERICPKNEYGISEMEIYMPLYDNHRKIN